MSQATPLLRCEQLTVRFGGLTALNRLNLSLADGEILGLIGPNGSGKTTFFNALTGLYRAAGGRMFFAGADITGLRPQTVYNAGIARTFQRSRLCLPLSVFDNLMIGNHRQSVAGAVVQPVSAPALRGRAGATGRARTPAAGRVQY